MPRSYLFRLIDLDNSDSLEDEEIVPLLKATGLDEQTARATARRLLGDQLTVRARPPPCRKLNVPLIRVACMRR